MTIQSSAIVVAAPYAPAGPIIAGTSASVVQIAAQSRQFTMNEFGLGFSPGIRVRAAFVDDPAGQWMEGVVTTYDPTTKILTVAVDTIAGDGSYNDWAINLTGEPGSPGPQGAPGPQGPQGVPGISLDSPAFIGAPTAPTATPATTDTNQIATTAFVHDAIDANDSPADGKTYGRKDAAWIDLATISQPLDGDLTSLAAAVANNAIYYRAADDSWGPVTIGNNLSFSGGRLDAAGGAGGSGLIDSVTPPFTASAGDLAISLDPSHLIVDTSQRLAIKPDAILPGAATATILRASNGIFSGGAGTGVSFYTNNYNDIGFAVAHVAGSNIYATMQGGVNNNPLISSSNPAYKITIKDAALIGAPTAVTPTPASDATTKVATTAFVQNAVAARGLKGHIYGVRIRNDLSFDSVNNLTIEAGEATSDDASQTLMVLAAPITKAVNAAWVVGTSTGAGAGAKGGRDTGASAADGYWHVFLIQRSDTGVVDVLLSLSPAAPTMPASYNRKRRIGSVFLTGAAFQRFVQSGDWFQTASLMALNTAAAFGFSAVGCYVPSGFRVKPIFSISMQTMTGGDFTLTLYPGDDTAGAISMNPCAVNVGPDRNTQQAIGPPTNVNSQVYAVLSSGGGDLLYCQIYCCGWIDDRGRNGGA